MCTIEAMIVEEFEGIVQHGSVEDGQERLGGLCARAVDANILTTI